MSGGRNRKHFNGPKAKKGVVVDDERKPGRPQSTQHSSSFESCLGCLHRAKSGADVSSATNDWTPAVTSKIRELGVGGIAKLLPSFIPTTIVLCRIAADLFCPLKAAAFFSERLTRKPGFTHTHSEIVRRKNSYFVVPAVRSALLLRAMLY